jgi:Lon protease-like protein
VGTIAQIEDLREVGDNRFLLRTTGRHRFRVVRQDRGADYLRAEIEPFPFASYNYQELLHTVPSLQEMIHTYMEKTTGGVESKVAQLELPEEPERLAFLAINLLQISMPEKQRYLEERDFPRFVAALQKAYRENIRLLNVLEKRVSQMGEDYPFSLN